MQSPEIVFLSGLAILGLLFWYLASDEERRKRNIGTALVLGIIGLCIWSLSPRSRGSGFEALDLNELTGEKPGWELNTKVLPAAGRNKVNKNDLEKAVNVLEARLGLQGRATLTSTAPDKIKVTMPGFSKEEAEEIKDKVEARIDEETLKPGIDLAGGASFTLKVQPKKSEEGETVKVDSGAVQQAIKTLRGRLNPKGTKDMVIQPQGEDMILIEMPGISEEEAAWVRNRITDTSILELRAVHPDNDTLAERVAAGETREPGYELFKFEREGKEGGTHTEQLLLSRRNDIKGKHVKDAYADVSAPMVHVVLTSEGGSYMRKLTAPMRKGKDRIAVVLDDVVMTAPQVNDTLSSSFVIEGIDGKDERTDLASTLMNPLENALIIEQQSTVTARLGASTVSQGIYAGIAGLSLTLVFLIIYYRIAGIIALVGLTINVLILFGAMAMFEFTFTLPGIAGIILTIGIAVDANVLIYERLREELKSGKSIRGAIQAAYEKAFTAIFDANITTLITAMILIWRATGTVKGFAITLTIGILASMFAALVATRVLFWWGNDKGVIKKLSFMHLVPEKAIDFMSKRKAALVISVGLLIASLLGMGIRQDKALGIDFAGGALIKFTTEEHRISDDDAREALAGLTLEKVPIIQNETLPPPSGAEILSIRCADEDATKIVDTLREKIGLLGEKSEDVKTTTAPAPAPGEASDDAPPIEDPWKYGSNIASVKASLGGDFMVSSIIALTLGLVGILLYITIRFEFSFAVGAFVALFHDVLIVIGVVIILGQELSAIHVGAILTIAGYSINDTIVVFDRIRESLRIKRGNVEEVMNIAINATLSRTILTSVTTFVAVLVLFIFGGGALKDFSLSIMIGVVVGTYSSIFVASPVVLMWSKMRGSNLRRELLDANLEAQVNPARS